MAVNKVTLLLESRVTLVVQEAFVAPELEARGQVLPFHWTSVFATKPPPLSVSVKPELLVQGAGHAGICLGDKKVMMAPPGL